MVGSKAKRRKEGENGARTRVVMTGVVEFLIQIKVGDDEERSASSTKRERDAKCQKHHMASGSIGMTYWSW